MQVPKLGALSKTWWPKHVKFVAIFIQIQTFIANISGTSQDGPISQIRKTAIPFAFGDNVR